MARASISSLFFFASGLPRCPLDGINLLESCRLSDSLFEFPIVLNVSAFVNLGGVAYREELLPGMFDYPSVFRFPTNRTGFIWVCHQPNKLLCKIHLVVGAEFVVMPSRFTIKACEDGFLTGFV